MNERVLMVATVPSMIGQFNMNNIHILLDIGYQVDVAADFTDTSVWPAERVQKFRDQMKEMKVETIQLDFSRSPLKLGRHIGSYKETVRLIQEHRYSFIHTHTPIASAIVRLAAKKTKTKVIYTAHGFHFYDGAPLKNWLLYYPVEKWLSKYTDILITINKEDYKRAAEKFKAKKTVYISGVGVDTEKFAPRAFGREKIRAELGLKDSDIMLLSVGELDENKNHETAIRAVKGMNVIYVIVGKGNKKDKLEAAAKECSVDLRLTGYRTDVADFYDAAEIYVLPSIREGLNVSLMEAMASGLACVCGRIRGNMDLIEDERCLFNPVNQDEIRAAIDTAIENRDELGRSNLEKIKNFDIATVDKIASEIYGGGDEHLRQLMQSKNFKAKLSSDAMTYHRRITLYYERKKVLILTNADSGLYIFRKEILKEVVHPGSILFDRKAGSCEVVIAAPEGKYSEDLRKLGCRTVDVSIDRRGMNPIKDLGLIHKYKTILDKERPDVVLTYTIKPDIYGGFLCGMKKISYISNITGLGTSIENNNTMSKIILLMYRLGLRSAHTIFFQNEENMKSFLQKKIVKNGKLIPGSGVNLQENNYEPYPEEDGELRFLFVGRIMRDKGITEFLDCAEYIKKKYPSTQFDILGDYDEEEYRLRIERLHGEEIIHYFGQQKDVHSFLKIHHATILSTYHEGLSNVLLESAATGRPVIATNIPGCQEAFDDGVTGIGFEPRDKDALIQAVEKFISLPYEQKKKMGIAARNKVEKEFDRKQVIAAYLDAMDIH